MKNLTKTEGELLQLFFTNPRRAFYMQELGRILGKKPGTFQRILNQLAAEGILQSEYQANARYFKINPAYPLYKELKSIIFKTVGVEGSLKKILSAIGKIEFAFIYGSFAKNRQNYLSDIDLTIIGNPEENKLIKALDQLEKQLQREINYKLYSLKELKQEIKAQEPFILEILQNRKIMLMGEEDELRKIAQG